MRRVKVELLRQCKMELDSPKMPPVAGPPLSNGRPNRAPG
jgi:hypothetical protein